ncbi:MAG TPA: metallophosphoesterase [Leptospiraceae bacterium]|nr:metallophosphoesterase [Leptospiraceae bacterium]
MVRFLHVADLHIGLRRYKNEERTDDFFLALKDVFEKYAIKEKVNFVLIAGDFFDVRKVEPTAMNHAITCLKILQDAKIPVIAIEGNHDSREMSSNVSWLRSLSQWGYIKLLEPAYTEDGAKLLPWSEENKTGSYIDIGKVRIYGTIWFGSTVSTALTGMLDMIRDVHDPKKFNILMLHTDVEGVMHHSIKGLSIEKMRELKSHIDYLALGHIHKNFVIDNWAYMPGSLEACSVDQYAEVRGAYLVEIKGKKHMATLVRDYYQRPIIRLSFAVEETDTPEEFSSKLFEFLSCHLKPSNKPIGEELLPIVELTVTGTLGFKTNLLNLNKVRDKIKKDFHCLLVLLKNQTKPVDFGSEVEHNASRSDIEKKVLTDLIAKDVRFKNNAEKLSDVIMEAKRLVLSGELPEKIAQMIEKNT